MAITTAQSALKPSSRPGKLGVRLEYSRRCNR